MSGFVVQGPKSDYRDCSGLKNGLYPKKKLHARSNAAINRYGYHSNITLKIQNISKVHVRQIPTIKCVL
jgi:hypothetical protein